MSAGTQGEIRVGPSHQVCHIYLEKSFRYLSYIAQCTYLEACTTLQELIDVYCRVKSVWKKHGETDIRYNRITITCNCILII